MKNKETDLKNVSRISLEKSSRTSFFLDKAQNCNRNLDRAVECSKLNDIPAAILLCKDSEFLLNRANPQTQDLELWKRLRSLYCDLFERASGRNLHVLLRECVQQALRIDRIIVALGGESQVADIKYNFNIFKKQAIQNPENKSKSDCAIM